MQGRGKFITLEGGEGSGKTTMIGRIGSYFEERGIPYVVTREPGGIEIAEKIRSIILDPLHTAMDARTEALLYAAARSQHLAEKVEPALRAGKAVICDRFVDSSLVYQGYARGLGIENVWSINRFAIGDLMPDVTLYLDIEPEVGLARIDAHDGREVNRLDLENLEFHRKVREGYFLLKEQFPERIRVIDASMKQEDVLAAMILSLETGILKDFDE
ncbi:dTMP kinase [Paenibacillus xylanexedens]|uniref:dTMP kinase n=1 Tax=Paenibacillus xylanexedens TaxID=528191 RepID=UPI0020A0D3E9|nr:dTMP kinase [Paenibacillus xylanexedens]MCP1423967.1 dTMP kinase [Paenibacillus xylanexedens]